MADMIAKCQFFFFSPKMEAFHHNPRRQKQTNIDNNPVRTQVTRYWNREYVPPAEDPKGRPVLTDRLWPLSRMRNCRARP